MTEQVRKLAPIPLVFDSWCPHGWQDNRFLQTDCWPMTSSHTSAHTERLGKSINRIKVFLIQKKYGLGMYLCWCNVSTHAVLCLNCWPRINSTWQYSPIAPTLGRQRQEGQKSNVLLSYIVSLSSVVFVRRCLKKKKNKQKSLKIRYTAFLDIHPKLFFELYTYMHT